MLSDALQQLVREAGGEAILLDARRSRALVTEFSKLDTILKNLRNAGFTRLIDFTAMHLGQNRHGLEEYDSLVSGADHSPDLSGIRSELFQSDRWFSSL